MINKGFGYFHFSKQQLDERTVAEAKLGNKYYPGTVIVKGKEKSFTDIIATPVSRYNDAILITQGELDKIKYNKPYAD
jgi:hypothetical protein